MKRIYHHYNKWEDAKNGMYKNNKPLEELIKKSYNLLASPKDLYLAMKRVCSIWVVSSEVNLSNVGCNRQAWLGQSACSLMFNAQEHMTKEAWHRLTQEQQIKANKIADKVIAEWETGRENNAKN